MSSAEAITDAVARHFKENVAGIKAAYGPAATGTANVMPLPIGIPDTPIAVIYWQRYRLESTAPETTRHYIDATVWFREVDTASAYKTYLPFVTLVRNSMRTNSTLYGTCTMAEIVDTGLAVPEVVDQVQYVRLTFHYEALEVNPIPTYT